MQADTRRETHFQMKHKTVEMGTELRVVEIDSFGSRSLPDYVRYRTEGTLAAIPHLVSNRYFAERILNYACTYVSPQAR